MKDMLLIKDMNGKYKYVFPKGGVSIVEYRGEVLSKKKIEPWDGKGEIISRGYGLTKIKHKSQED
jgi:hypothetical protein